jgi:Pyruvate/2-oxoacid:ferredoxin oxidoreductase delta subunit
MRNLNWRKIDRYSKKLRAINYLGGKCENCGENNIFKLNFHHIESTDKEYNMSKIKEGRWSIIKNEIEKCKLLCYNCHFEYHFDNDRDTYRKNITKKTLLEYKGLSGCEICGYNKCMGALDFHHPDSDDKDFILSSIVVVYKSVSDLKEKIENELDKCQVVCKNCHAEIHFDDNFFNDNFSKILEKSLNYREIQTKISREEVKKLYENGMRQIDIAKHFKAKKGTISGIIKELGLR